MAVRRPPMPLSPRCRGCPLPPGCAPICCPADVARLKAAGALGIELDVLTFDDGVLRNIGRHYRARLIHEQLEGIRALGLEVGVVLAVGLPGTHHQRAVEDARIAAACVDFARLHPVLVFDGARLRDAHMDGLYRPLQLGEAVTTCRAMLDVLEETRKCA